MFKRKDLEDKFKNLTVEKEEKLENPEELGAIGGAAISDTLVSDIDEYKSVFDGEITTQDLEEEHIYMPYSDVILDTKYILDTLLCKVYNEMYVEVINIKDYGELTDDQILNIQCDRDYQLYLKLKNLNLPFFVIGSRKLSLPKNKVKKTPHLDTILRENTGVLTECSYGSIMMLDHWWILTNDMLILGIIDNRIEVHIGSPRLFYTLFVKSTTRPHYQSFLIQSENYNSPKEYCMTNFGREILGLLLAGYSINYNVLCEILVPPKKYKKLKLRDYACAVMFFEYFGYCKYLLEKNLVGVDFDFDTNRLKGIITTHGYKKI